MVIKNAEFHADFESVSKVLKKMQQKKLLPKLCRKYAPFSLLLMSVILFLLITFLGAYSLLICKNLFCNISTF
jgi:hypothetical protein